MSRRVALLLLLILVAVLTATSLWQSSRTPEYQAATLFGDQARPLPEFSLLRHDAQALQGDDFKGRWSLLFFGYSQCPDICAPTLLLLSEVLRRLGDAPGQLVFVTLDPERDDAATLSRYVGHFHAHTLGVTGSEEQVQALARNFGAYGARRELATGYLVDHSSSVWLIDPEAQLAGVFTAPLNPDDMTSDLQQLIARHE